MRQRGTFEKITGSGVWWIRHLGAQGCSRAEKADKPPKKGDSK